MTDQNGNKQALVFFSYRSHKRRYIELLFERLQAAALGRRLDLHRGSLSDLQIQIVDNKLTVFDSLTNRDIANYDVVYFELWYKAPQQALAAATYLSRQHKPFFSGELLQLPALTKTGELAVMADAGIPLPDSFISSHREIKKAFKTQPPIDFPVIVKAVDGYGGKDNHLVKNYDELVGLLDERRDLQFVIQQFIPNDCDYRCLVFGGKIRLVLQRTRDKQSGSHLNNTSAGAEGRLYPLESLPADAQQAVLQAADRLGRSEFAGVDLLIDSESGRPYILEVNQTPQIEIGAAIDDKMRVLLDYMEERAA